MADIHPHKIDGLSFSCPHCGGDAKRISDVFDCWFESGSMPYAQDHYPFEKKDQFEARLSPHSLSQKDWIRHVDGSIRFLFCRQPYLIVLHFKM